MSQKNAKLTAFRMLSVKSRTTSELKKKLKLKGFSEGEIEEAVETCKRLGYLNDAEEKQRRIERLKERGYGPHFIGAKLQCEVFMSDEEQKQRIEQQVRKRSGKSRAQIVRALQRRGFDLNFIFETI